MYSCDNIIKNDKIAPSFLQPASVKIQSEAEWEERLASDVIRLVGTIEISGARMIRWSDSQTVRADFFRNREVAEDNMCGSDFQAKKLHLKGNFLNISSLKSLISSIEELEIEFCASQPVGKFSSDILDIIAKRDKPMKRLRIEKLENMRNRLCLMEMSANPDIFSNAICNVEDVSIDCMVTRELQNDIFKKIAYSENVSVKSLSIYWIEEDTDVEVFEKAVSKLRYVDLKLVSTFLFNKIFCSENLIAALPYLRVQDILPELM